MIEFLSILFTSLGVTALVLAWVGFLCKLMAGVLDDSP